jgi:hypothetical protein
VDANAKANFQDSLEQELVKFAALIPGAVVLVDNSLEIFYIRADDLLGIPKELSQETTFRYYLGVKVDTIIPVKLRSEFMRQVSSLIEEPVNSDKSVTLLTSLLCYDGSSKACTVQIQRAAVGLILYFVEGANSEMKAVAEGLKEMSQSGPQAGFMETLTTKTQGFGTLLDRAMAAGRAFGVQAGILFTIAASSYTASQQYFTGTDPRLSSRPSVIAPAGTPPPARDLLSEYLKVLSADRLVVQAYIVQKSGTVLVYRDASQQATSKTSLKLTSETYSLEGSLVSLYAQHLRDECVITDVSSLAVSDPARLRMEKASTGSRVTCPFPTRDGVSFVSADYLTPSKPPALAISVLRSLTLELSKPLLPSQSRTL